ncbi:signal peptidase I [Stenotrophomonas sp. C3(2023)]|uniref:signal peptidase I n=1 Tax=Stenotrophomonas sp. C3(2023) TaxID=3080277 RepID=UPI00293CD75B|nr:signal peptidase I [Stenotrophomonas sp. C3(2023)]MDV3467369.1 signal peptidase I [Stenotrophomonas sp. C3(2023)]
MDAVAPPPFSQRALQWLKKEALPLLIMLGLLATARDTLANHYQVPSGSMQPTLEPGDRVVVDMRAYGLRLPFTQVRLLDAGVPQRGEVAVFDSPADGTRLIKRVVAVAGDHVQVRNGHLSINGQALSSAESPLQEQFGNRTATLELDRGGGPDVADVQVPAGKLLVMGDHRGDSYDGRYFGWVDADLVYGRAVAVYYRRGEGLEWRRL